MNSDFANNHKNEFQCLIVEGNIRAAEILVMFLERNGIASVTAENGRAGLQMYFDNPLKYDMILIDLQMSATDGYEMTKRIRESGVSHSSAIPIVAMSSIYIGDVSEKGGFDCFRRKPFELEGGLRCIPNLPILCICRSFLPL